MEKKKRYLVLALVLAVAISCLVISILYPGIFLSRIFFFACILICTYVAISSFFLAVLLSALRKFDTIVSLNFVTHLVIVVAACLAINYLLSSMHIHLGDIEHRYILRYSILSTVIFLIFLNTISSKAIFEISAWKACVVGIIMGLISAFLVIATTTFCN